MPIPNTFAERLFPRLPTIAEHFGTPFFVYDEPGIRSSCTTLNDAFSSSGLGEGRFRNFFAVKALSNPHILKIVHDEGYGFDCSSPAELTLARGIESDPENIMFTSNNTSGEELELALDDGGCVLNLDDLMYLDKVERVGLVDKISVLSFRYNPGKKRCGGFSSIIGKPDQCKYGTPDYRIVEAYRRAQQLGVTRFGLHTMLVSNERRYRQMVDSIRLLLDVAQRLRNKLGIKLEFINAGGGIGIPYRLKDKLFDLQTFTTAVAKLLQRAEKNLGYQPKLYLECGRYVTGPHGVFIARVINVKKSYQTFVGLDAHATASIMRPVLYYPDGGYHHITVLGAEGRPLRRVNVVGSVCEDRERFAWRRLLPEPREGDLVVIHDCGAHAPQMGSRYNNRPLNSQELRLQSDGTIRRIRRAETEADLFATLECDPAQMAL